MTESINNVSAYNNMQSWLQKHENNTNAALNTYNHFYSPENSDEYNAFLSTEVEKLYEKNKYSIGNVFDFVNNETISDKDYKSQENDEVDEDTYQQALQVLGEGEVSRLDSNQDNKVSFSEYLASELSDVDFSSTSEEEVLEIITNASYLFQIIDEAMGNSNNSGYLEAEEFESFYKNLDKYEGDADDFANGATDGKIDIEQSTDAINVMVESCKTDETAASIKSVWGDWVANKIAQYTE